MLKRFKVAAKGYSLGLSTREKVKVKWVDGLFNRVYRGLDKKIINRCDVISMFLIRLKFCSTIGIISWRKCWNIEFFLRKKENFRIYFIYWFIHLYTLCID